MDRPWLLGDVGEAKEQTMRAEGRQIEPRRTYLSLLACLLAVSPGTRLLGKACEPAKE